MKARAKISETRALPAEFLIRMRRKIVKYFRWKGLNLDDAEDLTQDVLLRTFQHIESLPEQHAANYIFRTAVNRWHDHYRHTTAEEKIFSPEQSAIEHQGTQNGLDYVFIGKELLRNALRALCELKQRTLDIFIEARLNGAKIREVARSQGISASGVKKHLNTAIDHLTRRFRPPH